jgi:predicted Zn-dependent peptidase
MGPGALYPRLFTVEAYPLAPHTTEEVEAAIYEELERLKEAPPEDRELQRVRNQLEAAEIRRLRSNFGLALQIAGSASFYGNWQETFSYPRRIQEVTPEDIQRVVRRYFRKEFRTVATLVKPDEAGGGSP